MFATDADDAAVPAGAAVTHGRHSRWPLKVATQGGHCMLKRSLVIKSFALYAKNGH